MGGTGMRKIVWLLIALCALQLACAPQLPVVMVTKSENDATLREALGAEVSDYLVKPVSEAVLVAKAQEVLDRNEGPSA